MLSGEVLSFNQIGVEEGENEVLTAPLSSKWVC